MKSITITFADAADPDQRDGTLWTLLWILVIDDDRRRRENDRRKRRAAAQQIVQPRRKPTWPRP